MIKPQFSGPISFAAEMVKIKKNMLKDICEKKNNILSLSNGLKICLKKFKYIYYSELNNLRSISRVRF